MPHSARSFDFSPDAARAAVLLDELAAAPCGYAPVKTDRPLALYGAGELGRLACACLRAAGEDFVMAIDRNARKIADSGAWQGARLVMPDEITGKEKRSLRVAIGIVTLPYVPLERSLSEQGFADLVPFYDVAEGLRHRQPLSNGWFAAPLKPEERARTADVLGRWHDDVSRAHHLQFLAWRRLREEWSFAPAALTPGPRFLIPEVTQVLRDGESFVDAGAHVGTVSETFAARTGGRFRSIAAIEPDPASRAKLLERLPSDPRVTLFDCALAEAAGEATFHDGLDYASQLSPTGRMRVATAPLDALGLKPTFLKLHLEGGELPALKGGRETLLAHRPIVAATIYHNADGVFATPLWLMETLPAYRFLFRLDSWCGTGGVLYGIPEERYRH